MGSKNEQTAGQKNVKDEIESVRSEKGPKQHQRQRFICELVRSTLEERGSFCRVDNGSLHPDLYYFDGRTHRAYRFGPDPNVTDPAFLLLLKTNFRIAPKDREMLPLLADLAVEASTSGELVVPRRLWHWTGEDLYLNFHSNRVYRIGSDGIRRRAQNGDPVFFVDTRLPKGKLAKETQSTAEILRNVFPFDDYQNLSGDEQAVLFMIWAYTLPFGAALRSKPILLLQGPHGSGKTTLLKFVSALFYGDLSRFSPISRRDERDFLVVISRCAISLFDNVEQKPPWLEYYLASISTGAAIRTRQLYTTNEEVVIHPETWIVLNGIEPKVRRADVADRLIVLNMKRLTQRTSRPEADIIGFVMEHRDELLKGYVRDLQTLVPALAESKPTSFRSPIRMNDWAVMGWRIAKELDCLEEFESALKKLGRRQGLFALEHNTLFDVISMWLEEPGPKSKLVSSQLLEQLQSVADRERMNINPGKGRLSATALGVRLGQMKESMEQLGVIVEKEKGNGNRTLYSIRRVG